MSDSFAPVLEASKSAFTAGNSLEQIGSTLSVAMLTYRGNRSMRSAEQQNVFSVIEKFLVSWRDSDGKPGNESECRINLEDLRAELMLLGAGSFIPTVEPAPVSPEASILNLPQFTHPEIADLYESARKVIREGVHEENILDLRKKALLVGEIVAPDRPAAQDLKEEKLLQTCSDLVRAYRGYKLFGDGMDGPINALISAISAFTQEPAPAESKPIDLLGHVYYVWPIEAGSGFHSQEFSGGRPVRNVGTHPRFTVEEVEATLSDFRGAVIHRAAPKPYLYILMRTDIGSMNAGKAVAQGTHAANQMVFEASIATDPLAKAVGNPTVPPRLEGMVREWSQEARGFGTCIVLGVNEKQMRACVKSAREVSIHAGITHDPSYPVKDGGTFYTVPLDTCAYIFDYQAVVRPHVTAPEGEPKIELMP